MQLSSNKRTGLSVAAAIAVVAIMAAVAVATTRADKPPVLLPPTPRGTSNGKGCAPDSDRVDLQQPRFTHPTSITNPLFPISTLRSVVLLGRSTASRSAPRPPCCPGPQPSTGTASPSRSCFPNMSPTSTDGSRRSRSTATPRPTTAWSGISARTSSTTSTDRSPSAKASPAGRDGPPAMIMPAHPKPGQVFRAENIGVGTEELRVRDVDVTVDGPSGKVLGAVTMDELHVDGVTVSGKTFAPGYGEFLTLDKPDVEALAIAHGTDSCPGSNSRPDHPSRHRRLGLPGADQARGSGGRRPWRRPGPGRPQRAPGRHPAPTRPGPARRRRP